jgi:hypothetical protein
LAFFRGSGDIDTQFVLLSSHNRAAASASLHSHR